MPVREDASMEPMMMLRAAAGLFALAAVGGLLMAGIRLAGNRNPPIWLAYGHGLLAGAGLTLLVYANATMSVPRAALWSLLLLLAAAAGGTAMNLLFHWQQRPLPKPLLFGHMSLAVFGFILLLTVVM
jgi:hypothetical protein